LSGGLAAECKHAGWSYLAQGAIFRLGACIPVTEITPFSDQNSFLCGLDNFNDKLCGNRLPGLY